MRLSFTTKYLRSPWACVLVVAIIATLSYWLGTTQEPAPASRQTLILPKPGAYLALMPQDCQDTNTADATACILGYASTTATEADTLAQRLVLETPRRLQRLSSDPKAPVSFEYGGSDFLKDLPVGVKDAQQVRQHYIDTLCKLDSMNIYGGTGMDLEIGACEYYHEKFYLDVLKSLEGGLTATSK